MSGAGAVLVACAVPSDDDGGLVTEEAPDAADAATEAGTWRLAAEGMYPPAVSGAAARPDPPSLGDVFVDVETGERVAHSLRLGALPAETTLERASDPVWIVQTRDGATVTERALIVDGDGAVSIPQMENTARELITVFDPPFVLAPAELVSGEVFEQEVELTVRDVDAPDRVTRRGTGRQVIELVGMVAVPESEHGEEALLVRTTFTSTFTFASVRRTTERWYAPDEVTDGASTLVAERLEEVIRVVGVPRSKSHLIVRRDGSNEG